MLSKHLPVRCDSCRSVVVEKKDISEEQDLNLVLL